MPSHKADLSRLILLLGTLSVGVPLTVCGQLSPSERAALVLRLLPVEARAGATIVLRDGDREERYREGNGEFLCASDATNPDRISMVCHHHILEERLRFERQLSRETNLTGTAFRERLCTDVARRGWSVPDGAMEITASLSRDEGGKYASEMTVYHLLWLPHQSTEDLGVVDEDPGDGRPYLHHAGTCGAHVMWSEPIAITVGES